MGIIGNWGVRMYLLDRFPTDFVLGLYKEVLSHNPLENYLPVILTVAMKASDVCTGARAVGRPCREHICRLPPLPTNMSINVPQSLAFRLPKLVYDDIGIHHFPSRSVIDNCFPWS